MKIIKPSDQSILLGIKIWSGATIGLLIGMTRAEILTTDAFLTITGGFAGAGAAALVAIWTRDRERRQDGEAERGEVRMHLDATIHLLQEVREQIYIAAGKPDTMAELNRPQMTAIIRGIPVVRSAFDIFVEEALASASHLSFMHRTDLRQCSKRLEETERVKNRLMGTISPQRTVGAYMDLARSCDVTASILRITRTNFLHASFVSQQLTQPSPDH